MPRPERFAAKGKPTHFRRTPGRSAISIAPSRNWDPGAVGKIRRGRRPRAFRSSRVVVFLSVFEGSGLEWPEKALAKVTALQLYAALLCPCRGGPAERLTKVRAAPFTLKGFLQIQRASCNMATTNERVRGPDGLEARSVKALAAFCWCVPTRRRRPGLELIVLGSSTRSNRSSNDENNRSTATASIATWRI